MLDTFILSIFEGTPTILVLTLLKYKYLLALFVLLFTQ